MENTMKPNTYDPMEVTDYVCKRCESKVLKEVVPELLKEYPYYCPDCDENMYEFEVRKRE